MARISSSEPYFKNDTPFIDTLKNNNESAILSTVGTHDFLTGTYSFIVSKGIQGHILKLFNDSTFLEYMWTDVPTKHQAIKGQWFLKDSFLVLKDRNNKEYAFIYHQFSWTIFLIPVNKVNQFTSIFNKNRKNIDNLSPYLNHIRGPILDDSLKYLKQVCFYKYPSS